MSLDFNKGMRPNLYEIMNGGGGGSYVLPPATSVRLGGVMIGSGISVDVNGVISASELAPATSERLGGVKIGSGVNVSEDGTLSVTPYTLPVASSDTLGGIKVGTGLELNGEALQISQTNQEAIKRACKYLAAPPTTDTVAAWRALGPCMLYVNQTQLTDESYSTWPYKYGHIINLVGFLSNAIISQLYITRSGYGVYYRYQTSSGGWSPWRKLAEETVSTSSLTNLNKSEMTEITEMAEISDISNMSDTKEDM